MEAIKNIQKKIKRLSPSEIWDLDNYLDKILSEPKNSKRTFLKQDWAGSLKDVKMTSLELQKKALEWR